MKKRELTLKAGIFFVVLLLILSAVIMYEHKNDKNLTNKPLFIYTIKNTDDFNCLSRVEIIFDNLSYYFFSNAVSKYFIYNDSQLTESMLTNVHTLFIKDLTL